MTSRDCKTWWVHTFFLNLGCQFLTFRICHSVYSMLHRGRACRNSSIIMGDILPSFICLFIPVYRYHLCIVLYHNSNDNMPDITYHSVGLYPLPTARVQELPKIPQWTSQACNAQLKWGKLAMEFSTLIVTLNCCSPCGSAGIQTSMVLTKSSLKKDSTVGTELYSILSMSKVNIGAHAKDPSSFVRWWA